MVNMPRTHGNEFRSLVYTVTGWIICNPRAGRQRPADSWGSVVINEPINEYQVQ